MATPLATTARVWRAAVGVIPIDPAFIGRRGSPSIGLHTLCRLGGGRYLLTNLPTIPIGLALPRLPVISPSSVAVRPRLAHARWVALPARSAKQGRGRRPPRYSAQKQLLPWGRQHAAGPAQLLKPGAKHGEPHQKTSGRHTQSRASMPLMEACRLEPRRPVSSIGRSKGIWNHPSWLNSGGIARQDMASLDRGHSFDTKGTDG